MTFFDMVTDSPEALGDFLKSLSAANTPWEEHFQKIVCPDCEHYGKDCGKDCPNEGKRNNPTWWLNLGIKSGETVGTTIQIKAAFPLEWGREYYTVDSTVKQVRAACICCDNTGKVTIKGTEYECPRCRGSWMDREIVSQKTVYYVAKWRLTSITATPHGQEACFERTNGKTTGRWNNTMRVRSADFRDMIQHGLEVGKGVKIYDDYKSAMDRVKMLNAAEREKEKEASADG